MIKQFTLRKMFAVVTIAAIVLGLLRRPLAAILRFGDLPPFALGFWKALSMAFWIVGAPHFDTGYKLHETPGELDFGFMVGAVLGVFLWVAIVFMLANAIGRIWRWGSDE